MPPSNKVLGAMSKGVMLAVLPRDRWCRKDGAASWVTAALGKGARAASEAPFPAAGGGMEEAP